MGMNFHPNFLTKSEARLIAAILGYGCLSSNYYIFYANANENQINGFIKDAKNVFGKNLTFRIRYKPDNKRVKIAALSAKYGKILSKVTGILPGRKVNLNQGVPKFIFKLNKDKIAEFLAQIIDNEGSISIPSRHIRIKFAVLEKEKKCNLLVDIEKLLLKLGIESSIYKMNKYKSTRVPNRTNWQLEIHSFSQLEKLYRILNLRNQTRKNKFLELLKKKKQNQFPKRNIKEIYLSSMRNIQKNKGYFTTLDLQNRIIRDNGHIRNMVHKFWGKVLITKIEEVKSYGETFYPAKYRVV